MAIVQGFVGRYRPFPTAGFGFVGEIPEEPVLINLLSVTTIDDLHVLVTFDLPPAGNVLDLESYVITNPGGGVPVTVIDVALAAAALGDIYPKSVILTLANELTTGRAYYLAVSDIEGITGEVMGTSSATWIGAGTAPATASASGTGQAVIVVFTEAIDPTTVGLPADWACVPLASGVPVTVSSIVLGTSNQTAILTVIPELTTTEMYEVTAPTSVADPAGNLIGVRTAEFQAPRIIEAENGTLWAATDDGGAVDLGQGALELVPWGAGVPAVDLPVLVWLSLFSNRRAEDDDELPDTNGDPVNRGGVWFDTFSGDKFGSRLWLLARSPVNSTTILLARGYAIEALQWMIEDGLVARVDVTASRTGNGTVTLSVTLYQQDGTNTALTYADLWENLAA